ncbi:MAG: response regulator transcription factor [Rikenellaceae bacterium]|jgi:DNA-binding NarL/FixJ family response regulator|nr:response regulator transcription factor [Rikenellaceae bacterium]
MEVTPIRIVIVDDHNLFRNGLKGLFAARNDIRVVGEATNGADFLALLADVRPNVALLDIDMPVMGGIEAATKALAAYPNLRIVALSMHGEAEYYARMAALGARGFLLKDSSFDQVVEAIEAVAGGGSYLPRELDDMEDFKVDDPALGLLSVRETEILSHICLGESNHEIANRLFISKRTVDKHRANILEKTGCRNTATLVAWAITHSLVDVG